MPKLTPEDRLSLDSAREVMGAVFSAAPPEAAKSCWEFFANSLSLLSQQYPDRWGLTLFEWGARLNVGWVECLVLDQDRLSVLVEAELAPAGTVLRNRPYKRAPGCQLTRLSTADLGYSLASFSESHLAALAIAAQGQPPHRQIREAHSPGLVEFLSDTLSRPLENPSYYLAPQVLFLTGDEAAATDLRWEGARVTITVNRYERDAVARERCIAHHGLRCAVCNMSFGERYGKAMDSYIHVHHLAPLAGIGKEYQVDPIRDLRPVCPNCHAAIHHVTPPLSIERARDLFKVNAGGT